MSKILVGVAIIAGALLLGPVALFPFFGVELFSSMALATALIGIGASLVLGGIGQSLQHGTAANIAVRQSSAPWQIVYGRQRIGGVFAYLSVTNDQKYLHMVILHAAHPCHAINGYWLDGRQVFFSGGGQSGTDDGNTHTDPSGNSYNFHGHVYASHRLGSETSAAFPELNSYDGEWPVSGATLQGHCCSYIRCQYDENMWPDGYPAVRVDIAGKSNIYDPRSGTSGYSENPALCMADVLVNTDYGLQCNYTTEVDDATLIAAANLCDEAVALANGGSEPRYSCNGTFDCSMDPGSILKNMASACGGRLVNMGGLWRILPAGWISPTVSFTDDDFVSGIKWQPKRKYRDLSNAARGRFVCPSYPYNQYGPGWSNNQKVSSVFDGQWQACDVPYYAQDPLHGYGYAVRINSGGASAIPFSGDTAYAGGNTGTSTVAIDRSQVIHAGAAPENVYQSERWGTFTYTIGVNPSAQMNVRLHFAELVGDSAGDRQFNVDINGTRVLTNFDVFAQAGGKNKAIIREFTATANSAGHIIIAFTNGAANFPKISGIEVVPIAPDTNLATDNNTRLWMDLSLPYTISVAEAQRLLKIALLRNRQQGTGTIQVNLKGLQVTALDVIRISHSRLGWTNKLFEVTSWRLSLQDGENGDGTTDSAGEKGGSGPLIYVEMDIQEMDPAVYSWSTAEELSLIDNPSPVSPGQGQITQAALQAITVGNRNSSVVSGVSPISATDAGSSVDINIAAWTLQTGYKQVNYGAGVIHGASYSTRYYVYLWDKMLRGGTPSSYYATTDFSVVTSDPSYVYVDYILTPAQASSPTGGGGGGGGGTPGGPTKGNETGSAEVISQSSSGGGVITLNVEWYATNVPAGNIVQVQGGNFGNWSTIGSSVGDAATSTVVFHWVPTSPFPAFRVIDVTNGFTLN